MEVRLSIAHNACSSLVRSDINSIVSWHQQASSEIWGLLADRSCPPGRSEERSYVPFVVFSTAATLLFEGQSLERDMMEYSRVSHSQQALLYCNGGDRLTWVAFRKKEGKQILLKYQGFFGALGTSFFDVTVSTTRVEVPCQASSVFRCILRCG